MLNENFLEVFKKICTDKDLLQKFQGIKNDPDKAYELALSVSPAGEFTKQEFFEGMVELNKDISESAKKNDGELEDSALEQVTGGGDKWYKKLYQVPLGVVEIIGGVATTVAGLGPACVSGNADVMKIGVELINKGGHTIAK